MDFLGVCCYLPSFISDFTNLGLFPLHFKHVQQRFVSLVYFSKEPAFCIINSLYFFGGGPLSLILAPLFISFLLLDLSLAYSCFSSNLRSTTRSFIWDLSVLLTHALMATNLPLRTVFAISHTFW
jgi:hypothetical protein